MALFYILSTALAERIIGLEREFESVDQVSDTITTTYRDTSYGYQWGANN